MFLGSIFALLLHCDQIANTAWGPTGPFLLSATFSLLAASLVLILWTENYGQSSLQDSDSSADTKSSKSTDKGKGKQDDGGDKAVANDKPKADTGTFAKVSVCTGKNRLGATQKRKRN